MTNPDDTHGQPPQLLLLVEGAFDARLVPALLGRVGYPVERMSIVAAGPTQLKELVRGSSARWPRATAIAALVDADCGSVPDGVEQARRELGVPDLALFTAIPSVEAWLLTDPRAVGKALRDFGEIGIPSFAANGEHEAEERYDDKRLPRNVAVALRIVRYMDVGMASTRSPSLRAFLDGVGRMLGADTSYLEVARAGSLGREVLANLIAEVAPASSVIYRTMDGSAISAGDMIREVDAGSELGRQYASDLLRVSRDFLIRQARREARG
jgi:hypothetical protein